MMSLTYQVRDGYGVEKTWILDPEHSSHQQNMNEMSNLQRAYLTALLSEVLETLHIAKVRTSPNANQ